MDALPFPPYRSGAFRERFAAITGMQPIGQKPEGYPLYEREVDGQRQFCRPFTTPPTWMQTSQLWLPAAWPVDTSEQRVTADLTRFLTADRVAPDAAAAWGIRPYQVYWSAMREWRPIANFPWQEVANWHERLLYIRWAWAKAPEPTQEHR